jgi:putative two-component system response regulator
MSDTAIHNVKLPDSASLLVVDDEAYVRDLLSRWLLDAGYDCATCAEADAAWEHLESHEIHLVTLDIRMPGKSGIELLHRIKRSYPDTAVVMLTGNDDTQTAIDALTRGASGYLIKPVERQELLFHVSRALEHRQLAIEHREYTFQLEDKVREQTYQVRRAYEETVHRLVSAARLRDEETGAHIRRVGIYSALVAEGLGWSPAKVEGIRIAATMHDVGKIGIPDSILRKPGRLSPEEFDVMKEHTRIGREMLAGSDSEILRMAEEIALHHHEKWDGRGYPMGLSEVSIPESAQIVGIADVYDALTHDRVYRPAMSEGDALAILEQGRGSHFDPVLLDLFLCLVPELRRIAEEHPDEIGAQEAERIDPTLLVGSAGGAPSGT